MKNTAGTKDIIYSLHSNLICLYNQCFVQSQLEFLCQKKKIFCPRRFILVKQTFIIHIKTFNTSFPSVRTSSKSSSTKREFSMTSPTQTAKCAIRGCIVSVTKSVPLCFQADFVHLVPHLACDQLPIADWIDPAVQGC